MSGTGVWLIGARGNVSTTAIVGAHAISRGLTSTAGMVTAQTPIRRLDLPAVSSLVFGGHDIRADSLEAVASEACDTNGVPDRETLDAVREDLRAVDERIRTGTARNCGQAVADLRDGTEPDLPLETVVERLRDDYATFRQAHDLDRVVVVNVASSEPSLDRPDRYDSREAFEDALADDDPDLPASSLYAYAALVDGHPYVNFTPSVGSALGGLREIAAEEDVPHVGRDAKTGETLVKSALAPMFAARNLQVLAWEGHNILGNTDGLVLDDDANKAGKLESKGSVLDSILGEEHHSAVHIDYTPSLGDWKTAWDYIHFQGFLETEMTLQFTWEGSDSALAAPLVLDLVRLVAHADANGNGGVQRHLASFFKSPMGVDEHDLSRQFELLTDYAEAALEG